MKSLNQKNIEIVKAELTGKRLEKFNASVSAINESLKIGGWLKGVSRKADTGFYQGLFPKSIRLSEDYSDISRKSVHGLEMCVNFGHSADLVSLKFVDEVLLKKHSKKFYTAWMELCNEKTEAIKFLNSLRPLPVITPVGLSPKVTDTLKNCNLDLKLNTIRMPEFVTEYVQARTKSGKLAVKDGKPVMVPRVKIIWPDGTLHNQSRFTQGNCCQACGKWIPSGMFVPVVIDDAKLLKPISMWLGCDCAKNIFGVKDLGFKNKGEAEVVGE